MHIYIRAHVRLFAEDQQSRLKGLRHCLLKAAGMGVRTAVRFWSSVSLLLPYLHGCCNCRKHIQQQGAPP